jgi:hypothetical protein
MPLRLPVAVLLQVPVKLPFADACFLTDWSQRAVQIHRRKPELRSSAEARFPRPPGKTACSRLRVITKDRFMAAKRQER